LVFISYAITNLQKTELLVEVTLTREDESSIKRYVSPPYSVYLMFQTASTSEQIYSEDIGSMHHFNCHSFKKICMNATGSYTSFRHVLNLIKRENVCQSILLYFQHFIKNKSVKM
jgi:hypothetical protein